MFEIAGPSYRCGDGLGRRSFLRVGFLVLGGLSLADYLRLKGAAAERGQAVKDTSVILLFLNGGPSHLDMYDLKPAAPVEYRGEFREIPTSVSGIRISEHLPLQARQMDKMAIVRSIGHTTDEHQSACHGMMTGYFLTAPTTDNRNPSIGSITSRLRGANAPRLPAYVCLPDRPFNANGAYLGASYNPFVPGGDPNDPNFRVRDLRSMPGVDDQRFQGRRRLIGWVDNLRRDMDVQGTMEAYDRFYQDAFQIVTSAGCRKAFALHQEDPRLRDRYGRHTWGQSTLLARRLVEAGVTFVTVNMPGWDTHGGNFVALKNSLLPRYDQALATLVADVHDRGLDKKVLVVAYGEFGRTPRVNKDAGRDHWPAVMSVVLAGGGLRMGQVVGSTDPKGETPKICPLGAQDLLATIYDKLGIDYHHVFYDEAQRPISVLGEGKSIKELL